jgi:hypothetical protein
MRTCPGPGVVADEALTPFVGALLWVELCRTWPPEDEHNQPHREDQNIPGNVVAESREVIRIGGTCLHNYCASTLKLIKNC